MSTSALPTNTTITLSRTHQNPTTNMSASSHATTSKQPQQPRTPLSPRYPSQIPTLTLTTAPSSSPTPSPTCSSFPSTTPSSPPHPTPTHPANYATLERLLLALVTLTRHVYLPARFPTRSTYATPPRTRHYLTYTQLHGRVARFAARHAHVDFVKEGTWGWLVECAVLLRLVGVALGGPCKGEIEGVDGSLGRVKEDESAEVLGWKVGAEEWNRGVRRVGGDVEGMVFRSMDLDCARLPWNLRE